VVALLASAPDAKFDDLPAVVLTMQAAISGAVRSALERGATPRIWRTMRATGADAPRLSARGGESAFPSSCSTRSTDRRADRVARRPRKSLRRLHFMMVPA
jgi:hypothetical protein